MADQLRVIGQTVLLGLVCIPACVRGANGADEARNLLSPKGGEAWAGGSYHVVRWDPRDAGETPNLKAEFSTDGGATWSVIPDRLISARDGQLPWRVPDVDRIECQLRITNPSSAIRIISREPFRIIPAQVVGNYPWGNVTREAEFASRDGAGSLTFNGKMFLIGGWNPGDKKHFPLICNNEVWSSTGGETWMLIKPNTFLNRQFDPTRDWEGRHAGGDVVYRDRMWLIGGVANQGHYQPDIWNSSDGVSWKCANADSPPPWRQRALQHTLVFQDRIWVLGGQTMPAFAPAREAFFRDTWTTTDGATWTEVKPEEPYWLARGIIGGRVVFNGRMWILGGGTRDTPMTRSRDYDNDVWSSDDGIHWQQHTASAPWVPRQYHHVTVYDGRIWVLRGYRPGDRNDVWYSSDGTNWNRHFGAPWAIRHAASVFVHDGSLWITAGSCMQRDVWRLQRSDDQDYRSPVEPDPLAVIEIQMDGVRNKRIFAFDPRHPDGSPKPFDLYSNMPTRIRVYSLEFGLSCLDDKRLNEYAEMRIQPSGVVEFLKWRDGGEQTVIAVENKSRPRRITIRKRARKTA